MYGTGTLYWSFICSSHLAESGDFPSTGTISLFDEEEKKTAPLRNYQYNAAHHLVLLKTALLFS
jgi:hypothetical protein